MISKKLPFLSRVKKRLQTIHFFFFLPGILVALKIRITFFSLPLMVLRYQKLSPFFSCFSSKHERDTQKKAWVLRFCQEKLLRSFSWKMNHLLTCWHFEVDPHIRSDCWQIFVEVKDRIYSGERNDALFLT